MWGDMEPDTYAGDDCDGIVPSWTVCGEGDKDGPEPIGGTVILAASTFPPGTRVVVSVPECPDCGETADMALDHKAGIMGPCSCGFDWENWTREVYS